MTQHQNVLDYIFTKDRCVGFLANYIVMFFFFSVTPDVFEALQSTADGICGSLPSGKNATTKLPVSDAFGSDTSSASMIVGQLTMFLVVFIAVLF